LEKATQELARLKESHAAEIQSMTARLQAAKTEWEAEKANLAGETAKLRQSATAATAAKKGDEQLDKRLQDAIQKRDGLTADLEKAGKELSQLKAAHAAELQNVTSRLQSAKAEWESEKATLAGEAAKLRQSAAVVSTPKKGDEQLDKRLQETIRTRDGLSADLEKSKHEIAKLKETHSAELKDFTTRYIQTRTTLEKQLQESEETRGKLERELEKAQKASAHAADAAPADGALSEELSRLKKELDAVQEEKKRLVLRLAETDQSSGADIVNDLRQQYEGRIQEMLQENTHLAEKLKKAAADMDGRIILAVADGAAQNGSSVSTLDSATIDEEVKRVEVLIAEIAQLIDNPETELATVIRKNVERAALESYLKGILFSLGRGK
jgi:chromosome segregation ATPase